MVKTEFLRRSGAPAFKNEPQNAAFESEIDADVICFILLY